MNKVLLVMASTLLLTSCATHYTSSGEHRYLKSQNGRGINVPPPLTDANISHFYDLPQQHQNAVISIAPPQGS